MGRMRKGAAAACVPAVAVVALLACVGCASRGLSPKQMAKACNAIGEFQVGVNFGSGMSGKAAPKVTPVLSEEQKGALKRLGISPEEFGAAVQRLAADAKYAAACNEAAGGRNAALRSLAESRPVTK